MGPAELQGRWTLRRMQVLRRVLQEDPEQEYFVYVPSAGGQGSPLFVAVHGVARNASEQARLFAPYAERLGVVLVAPAFSGDQHDDYQRLGREGRGARADLALDAIVEEIAWLTGAAVGQIHLFGYSGGAQFAHRYVMAYPQRVARAVIASAGWYTFPDPRHRFPYGIRPSRDLPRVRFDPEEFLRVPMAVLVGDLDTTDDGLRRTKRVDRQQGTTRVERAQNWVEAMRAAAEAHHLPCLVSLGMIAGGDHSFRDLMKTGQLGERVVAALFEARVHPEASDDGKKPHRR